MNWRASKENRAGSEAAIMDGAESALEVES